MKRTPKNWFRWFPIFWTKCLRCRKEFKFEVMYYEVDDYGDLRRYCKKCHEWNHKLELDDK